MGCSIVVATTSFLFQPWPRSPARSEVSEGLCKGLYGAFIRITEMRMETTIYRA